MVRKVHIATPYILKYLLALSLLLAACAAPPLATPTPTAPPPPTATMAPTATLLPSVTPTPPRITGETADQITKIGKKFPIFEQSNERAPLKVVAFRGNETLVAELRGDGQNQWILITDFDTRELLTSLVFEEKTNSEFILRSPDSRLLASVSISPGVITIWDLETFELVSTLTISGFISQRANFYHIVKLSGSFSPDNRLLVVSGCTRLGPRYAGYLTRFCASSRTVIFDLETSTIVQTIDDLQVDTWESVFSPDGDILALAGKGADGGSLLIWDVAAGEVSREIVDALVFSTVAFDPTGETLAVFSYEGRTDGVRKIQLWDTRSWDLISTMIVGKSGCCLAFVSGSNLVVMDDGGGVALFDFDSKRVYEIRMLIGHVVDIFVSPDQRYLYVISAQLGLEKWGIP